MNFPAESSNSLFHFTSRTSLVNILENNFIPQWGFEDLRCVIPDQNSYLDPEGYIYSFPKVCFCDIPLSRVGKHMGIYGKFCLGLTKDWGRRNGLNPVLYVHAGSMLAQDIFRTNEVLARESLKIDDQGHQTYEEWEDAMRQHSLYWEGSTTINYFIKPYRGDFIHAGEEYSDVRFYDEREWRFVPRCEEPGKVFMVFKSHYDAMSLEQRNEITTDVPKLMFELDDIRYIIVEKDEDILSMYHDVLRIKSENKNYTTEQLQLLTTRIVSSERICEDF